MRLGWCASGRLRRPPAPQPWSTTTATKTARHCDYECAETGGTSAGTADDSAYELLGFEQVSLVELIAGAPRLAGKRVMVEGYCPLEFEGNALYLHRDDHEYGISKNAVWLDV